MRKIVAYRLQPVFEQTGGIATAAVMSCMATGRMLSGMGGGGEFLAPEIVDALRERRSRTVCDTAAFDALVAIARRAADGEDVGEEAKALIASGGLAGA